MHLYLNVRKGCLTKVG